MIDLATDNSVEIAQSQQNEENQFDNQQELGQDVFFELLITQLNNQDPLKPMENTEFVSQMAEFSSLEKSEKIYQLLADKLDTNQVLNNANLIGKEIAAEFNGIVLKGEVTSVMAKNDQTVAVLDDGSEIEVENIKAVSAKEQG
ncbi:flagellar biosynthesis protein FlgD [Halanaerobium sp. Z-7514]|uniref:Flagellar biosynthesis protein FlgD n=1 Tax=Halanaerobium polyolivorans TaxID=2886943 RepID=A0AAW4X074_9FIRM|nr:flagellar hook capping FlgD N-terminal domain-containing protein [Halanaerobium polyolivorans]MCC3145203.1 flagellar biosynthesis protein FlgD [Halanaerobium polyolivorans]